MLQILYITQDWVKDLIIVTLTAIFVISSILIPKSLEENGKISKFTARKIIHSFSGLAIFIAPYLTYSILAAIFALLLTFVTRTSGRKSKTRIQRELYEAINEDEELEIGYLQGPYAYCLSITIVVSIFILFPEYYFFPIAAVLIMMYADSLAGYFGRRFGKHHINVPLVGNKRTVEGSIVFLIASLVISYVIFLFFGKIYPGNLVELTLINIHILSISISVIATLLELVSPSKYDDLIVPIGSTFFISAIALFLL